MIHPWIPATKPWERIHIDFCQYNNDNWLIIVDAKSKWVEIINMKKNTDSTATIRELRRVFSTFGLPTCVVSDNGPQLVSEEITDFYKKNGIKHIPIPSYKPQCNGLAERMVNTFKSSMKKMKIQSKDVSKNVSCWLLTYRNTPHATSTKTPTELMFGRRTRSLLSLLYPQPSSDGRLPGTSQVYREFNINDQVLYKNVRHDTWVPGVVVSREGSKVYLVEGQQGEGTHRKHIDQLTAGIVPDAKPGNVQVRSNGLPLHAQSEMLSTCNKPTLTVHRPASVECCVKPSSLPNDDASTRIDRPSTNTATQPTPLVSQGPCPMTLRSSSRVVHKPIARWSYDVLGGKN